MKLSEFVKLYPSKAAAARAAGVSPQHLTGLLALKDASIRELKSGDFVLVTQRTKVFKRRD